MLSKVEILRNEMVFRFESVTENKEHISKWIKTEKSENFLKEFTNNKHKSPLRYSMKVSKALRKLSMGF
jgi:hypothetical protein